MMRMTVLVAALALGACATAPMAANPVRADGQAALGEATRVGRLVVTPTAVIEDSRCPVNVRCIWAGRLVLRTRIDGGGWLETRDLVLGEPQAVRDNRIALVAARPQPQAGVERQPSDYLFAFEGSGGR